MSELNEDEAIGVFLKEIIPYYKNIRNGFLDDSSAISLGDNLVFFKIDGTSLKSSLYPWMGLDDLAFRVCAGAVTDVIAKGGRPISIAVSVGLPKSSNKQDIGLLGKGVADFLRGYSLSYAGGDMNSVANDDGWLDVAVVGYGSKFIPNGPLKVGEEIYVNGCLGLSSLPALIHYRGHEISYLSPDIIAKLRRPEVPFGFLELVPEVNSSTDISDGLRSLRRVLKLSNVALRLVDELPLCEEVMRFMEETGLCIEEILQFLGEEYLIAYSGSSDSGFLLGEIVSGRPGSIIYEGKEIIGGWDNFKGFIH